MTAAALANSVGLHPDDWGSTARCAAPNTPERSLRRSVVRVIEPLKPRGLAVPGTLAASTGVEVYAEASSRTFVFLMHGANEKNRDVVWDPGADCHATARIFVRLPRSAHSWSTSIRAAPFEGSCPMEDCRHEEVTI